MAEEKFQLNDEELENVTGGRVRPQAQKKGETLTIWQPAVEGRSLDRSCTLSPETEEAIKSTDKAMQKLPGCEWR